MALRNSRAVVAASAAALLTSSVALASRGGDDKGDRHKGGDKSSVASTKAGATTSTLPPGATPQYGQNGRAIFSASLLGKSEVGADGRRRAGNPFGRGGATISIKGQLICVGIVTVDSGVSVAAHIHAGRKGENGPIVLTLPTPAPIQPGSVFASSSSSCQQADQALLDGIRYRAKKYYVNVHTTDFPNGALRGQLSRVDGDDGRH